ncbi:MAG: hypothetical protein LC127_18610 [Chitinophagales bacterium]|nr:hypothetical protein [Chitinophagales bacterium]
MYNSSHQKKYIVITTINEPNSIVRKYYQWKGWEIIIVGDKKTSDSWHQENVTYLDIHAQQSMFPHLAKYIPFNTYTRKIFGYCYAIKNKADYIFETDDDNAPYPNAQQALEKIINQQKLASVKTLSSNTGWVNIYRHFTDKHIWQGVST